MDETQPPQPQPPRPRPADAGAAWEDGRQPGTPAVRPEAPPAVRPERARPAVRPEHEYTVVGGEWQDLPDAAEDDLMVINMGPQHPSTHGVLRMVLTLDGEVVVDNDPVIGYLHTGIEKNTEVRPWTLGVTYVTRMDYLSPLFNELGYCLAVEKLLGITDQVPERASALRVILTELNRISSHLVWLEMRLSSVRMTRSAEARSGTWSVMPSSFSTARQ